MADDQRGEIAPPTMRLQLTPTTATVAPGEPCDLVAVVRNDGDQPAVPSISVSGMDSADVQVDSLPAELAPGRQARLGIHVSVPPVATPGDQRLAVTVADDGGWYPPQTALVDLVVGAPPPVSVEVVPPASRGRRAATVTTVVHNRSDVDQPVALDAASDGTAVAFAFEDLVVPPGGEVQVPTAIRADRRSWLRVRRHGTLVRARTDGAPVSATATFTQRPTLPPVLVKVVAFAMVLALWAAAVVVVIDRVEGPDSTAEMAASGADGDGDGTGGAGDGDGTGAGDAGRDGGQDGAGTSGEDGAGGADGTSGDGGADGTTGGATGNVVVAGTVTGPDDPAGTSVLLQRVAFGDAGTTASGGSKVMATSVAAPAGQVLDRIETATDEQGSFRIAGALPVPGFYRVKAARAGYQTASHVVYLTEEEREAELTMVLDPASGSLAGTVRDADGNPLGGADVQITDGSVVHTARSATEGAVGAWQITGLTTPATYEVLVTRRGYASASLRVALGGGESRTGVDTELVGGVGTLRGVVQRNGRGVGGITVELVGDGLNRSTTTTTDGAASDTRTAAATPAASGSGLAGRFDFPALPYGTYRLTFSGDGWLSQTTEVVVDRGDVEVTVADLRPSTATLQGVVHQEVLPDSGCAYPNPQEPEQRDTVVLEPCGGVGVAVAGEAGSWGTTTANGTGRFTIAGILPGEYQVRFERVGYVTQYYALTVDAGEAAVLPDDRDDADDQAGHGGGVIQMRLTPEIDRTSGTIQGVVRDARDLDEPFEPPAGTSIRVIDQPDAVVERAAAGVFTITNLPAGAHTVRVDAPGFDTLDQVARVPVADVADLGALPLVPLGSMDLRITGGQAVPVPDAQVFVAPDPTRPVDGGAPRFLALGDDVTRCTRSVQLDGATRSLDGLCATTDGVGEVSFDQTFATGSYLVVAPMNETDPTGNLARTIPLDHRREVRRIDLDTGGLVRVEMPLQRYPIITGGIYRPTDEGEGLVPVVLEPGDVIEFDLINPLNGEILPLPAGAPTPRISTSLNSDLAEGRYRIDRIPADVGDTQYTWRLLIEADGGRFLRNLQHEDGPVRGLVFNEERDIAAFLLPKPVPVRFTFTADLVGHADAVPVANVDLEVEGTSGYTQIPGEAVWAPIRTTCPSATCRQDATDGQVAFSYTTTIPEELDAASQPLTGQFRIPPFYRPGTLDYAATAPGFDPVSVQVASFPAAAPDGTVEFADAMDPTPRDVTVDLDLPAGLDLDWIGEQYGTVGDPYDEADLFGDLTVTLEAPGEVAPVTGTLGTDGQFAFDDVRPGRYQLDVTMDGDAPPLVEAVVDAEVEIAPGAGTVAVDRALDVRGAVAVTAVPSAGLTAAGGPDVPITFDDLTVERDADPVGAVNGGVLDDSAHVGCLDGTASNATLTCEVGEAQFYGVAWPAGSQFVVSGADVAGYLPASPGAQMVAGPFGALDIAFDRFGIVEGTVSYPSGGTTETLGTADDGTVTLVDHATGLAVLDTGGNPITATIGDGGTYRFDHTLEIRPRGGVPTGLDASCPFVPCVFQAGDAYALSFSAPNFVAEVTGGPMAVAMNTVDDVSFQVEPRSGTISGVVSAPAYDVTGDPGEETQTSTDRPVACATVTVSGHGETYGPVTAGCDTSDAGAYAITDVAPGRNYTISAAAPDDWADLQASLSGVALGPGQVLTGEDILLAWPDSTSITARVSLLAHPGATPVPGDDKVTVDVESLADPPATFDETVTWAGDGTVTITDVPAGAYRVTFSQDGYTAVGKVVVTAQDGVAAAGDVALTAEPTAVTITITSDHVTNLDAGGLTVTATADTSTTAPTGSDADAYTFSDVVNAGEDQATLVLPPGDWLLSTSGAADLDPPHADQDGQALEVTASTASATIELPRYVQVAGSAVLQQVDGGTRVDADDSVTIQVDGGAAHAISWSGNDWTVWLADLPTTVELSFALDGYTTETVSVGTADLDAGCRCVTGGDVVLSAETEQATVTLTSDAGASLDGLTAADVLASASIAGFGTVTVVSSSVDTSTGVVAFDALPAGAWTVAVDTSGMDRYHSPPSGCSVSVTIDGAEPDTATCAMSRPVVASGTLVPQNSAGDAVAWPTGANLTATVTGTGDVEVETPTAGGSGAVTWSAHGPDISITVTFRAAGFGDTKVTRSGGGYTVAIEADPVDVEVTVTTDTARDVDVTGTYGGPGTLTGVTTNGKTTGSPATAVVTLSDVAPGPWEFSATDGTDTAAVSDTVPVDTDTSDPALSLSLDVVPAGGAATTSSPTMALRVVETGTVSGRTLERHGSTEVLVGGVEVVAERDGETVTAISGKDGAYRLDLPAGTWRVTAAHGGATTVVTDAVDVTAGAETPLDVVLPTDTVSLAGQVVDVAGASVVGATVTATSSVGTVTGVTGEDGGYVLDGLDNTVTWAVHFTPPAGMEAQPVTRWVAFDGDDTTSLTLAQELPTALGEIAVRIAGGVPSSAVAVSLVEVSPFPTVDADGRLDFEVVLDGAGTGTVRFDRLVPGDGRSVPQNRFTVEVRAPDADPATRTGLDVGPGLTTTVEVDLGGLVDMTRDVVLTLVDGTGTPITDRLAVLQSATATLPGTVEPGTGTHTFTGVDPGPWEVVVDGHEPVTVDVPVGDGPWTATVTLVPTPSTETVSPSPSPTPPTESTSEVPSGATASDGATATEAPTPSETEPAGSATGGATAPDSGSTEPADTGTTTAEPSPASTSTP